ncbi:hypothetical protein VHA_002102 [Grimontia hollisae CIP 101886]|uniref:Uncharacterized protein n=1 Tax=Grimontia hollisae CIP 101886 TaxID=675812 RepID=D0I8M7_GRIHO|nr:hypothetical protein VHA_002102 [Grimontia hollisae CIP 101886]
MDADLGVRLSRGWRVPTVELSLPDVPVGKKGRQPCGATYAIFHRGKR